MSAPRQSHDRLTSPIDINGARRAGPSPDGQHARSCADRHSTMGVPRRNAPYIGSHRHPSRTHSIRTGLPRVTVGGAGRSGGVPRPAVGPVPARHHLQPRRSPHRLRRDTSGVHRESLTQTGPDTRTLAAAYSRHAAAALSPAPEALTMSSSCCVAKRGSSVTTHLRVCLLLRFRE
jgi:hypothetical protein